MFFREYPSGIQSTFNYTLLGHVFFTPKVFLHEIYTHIIKLDSMLIVDVLFCNIMNIRVSILNQLYCQIHKLVFS